MRWVFCINFRGLYLASEDTSRDAVFAALIFEKGRTRQSDKNRGSIIRVTGPLKQSETAHLMPEPARVLHDVVANIAEEAEEKADL